MTQFTIPDYLVCPVCKGPLQQGGRSELVCPRCALAFEVRGDIPNMIRAEARALTDAERDEIERRHKEAAASARR